MKSENSVADNIHSELFAVSVVIDVVSDCTAVWIYDPKLHDTVCFIDFFLHMLLKR